MTRDVVCYLTNNTPYGYSPQTQLSHGKESPLNAQSVSANEGQKEVFSFSKSTGSVYGVTGTVNYLLNDGSTLQLSFNNPYTQDGNSGNSNVWFYAGIIQQPPGGGLYTVAYSASVDGNSMNASQPASGDTITAYVTLNYNA